MGRVLDNMATVESWLCTLFRSDGLGPRLAALLVSLTLTNVAAACPFCSALGPTLSQRRDQSTIAAIVESALSDAGDKVWIVHQSLRGPRPKTADLVAPPASIRSGLAIAFGVQAAATASDTATGVDAVKPSASLDWEFVPLSELACGYLIRAPQTRVPVADRLRYFARWLESSDPLIAEDAYLEFGHAPYDNVAKVADALDMQRLRDWLVDEAVPPARKGFYGLALGLARDPNERKLNRELLERLVSAPTDGARAGADFRAGFDGVLGGYLMLAGPDGLELIRRRYFANPDATVGDLRHALTALRFYHEYGREISLAQQAVALRCLVEQPRLADAAIVDLARWQDWESLPAVVGVYGKPGFDEPRVRRAIIGYLRACPLPAAAAALTQLRARDPDGVQTAERSLGELPASGDSSAPPQ
jgi:hypothetical protein